VKVLLADGAREFTPPKGARVGPARARPAPPAGVAALFASGKGVGSHESRNLRHGVFFYYVNKGLAGAAVEGRAGITFAALRKYVEREVLEHARVEFDAEQAPALAGAAPTAVLASAAGTAAALSESLVVLETSLGEIVIELHREQAPLSSANFLTYVDEGFYDGTVIHRTIPNFVIQGGGFLPGMKEKPARAGVKNEAGRGLSNRRGTVAVARAHDPDSGTCQFYINLKDNPTLDRGNAPNQQAGYAVFGRVVEGMDVVDRIAGVATVARAGHHDVPAQDVIIRSARRAAAR
jgi:cyclophilin family peptidyl-prolyl cis-trans isomerase